MKDYVQHYSTPLPSNTDLGQDAAGACTEISADCIISDYDRDRPYLRVTLLFVSTATHIGLFQLKCSGIREVPCSLFAVINFIGYSKVLSRAC